MIDKRIQHLLEKGLTDIYKKIAGDDITKSMTQVSTLNHLGSNRTERDMTPLYFDRIKEILRDELVREKEAYIAKLHSQLQQNTQKRKEVLGQIERVEGEYGEVAKQNSILKQQIKQFEKQFEEALEKLDQRDQHILDIEKRY